MAVSWDKKTNDNQRKNMNRLMKRYVAAILAFVLVLGSFSYQAAAKEKQTGTFTAVTLNVDGLPKKILFVDLNADGPGEDGTKAISQKMATYGWDLIGVSEDFNYHTELMSGLTDYSCGTYGGKVSGLSNSTDGLNLLWKNSVTVSGESRIKWNDNYASGTFGTGNGADTMITKGYRFYQATMAEGVVVDVYILHMDADSDPEDIAARESQLQQLAAAIKASDNKNPILVMGDTNSRYTRENLKTLFIDSINEDSRFTIEDAWIEKIYNGTYPQYGDDAMVAVDKGGTYEYPQAEIVDKVFYINNTDSEVTLAANNYQIATDFVDSNGSALADHWPVVVEFSYTIAGESVCSHDYKLTSQTLATCTEDGSKVYTCSKCEDCYTETIEAKGHTAVIDEAVAPTCTSTGLTEGKHCAVCNEVLIEQEIVAKLNHNYQSGFCTECGAKDPEYQEEQPTKEATLGAETRVIESGKKYMIAFSGTTGIFAMERTVDQKIIDQKKTAVLGDRLNDTQYWTLTEAENGCTISTEIDGKTYYVYRTNAYTGRGYTVALRAEQPFVWKVDTKSSASSIRFYVDTSYGSKYYLRYYNAKVGFIAASKAAGLRLYEVVE